MPGLPASLPPRRGSLRPSGRRRRHLLVTEGVAPAGCAASRRRCRRLFFLLGSARKVTARSSRSSPRSCRATERAARWSPVVNRLNDDAGRRRMELAHGLGDLPDDRKASLRSGRETRRALCEIDLIVDVPGDDEIGIAGPVAPRQRDDEVRDGPPLLGRERIGRTTASASRSAPCSSSGRYPRELILHGRSSSATGRRRVSGDPSRPSGSERKVRRRGRVARGTARSRCPRRASCRPQRTRSRSARSGAGRAAGPVPCSRSRERTS